MRTDRERVEPGGRAEAPSPEAERAKGEGAERCAEVLAGFCRAFVELRRGCEEFGEEMGVRVLHGEGGVRRARDGEELLAYLLEGSAGERTDELQRAFEELKVHQMALVEGAAAGGRALVERLSPEAVSAAAGGVWPLRAGRRWKELEARHRELTGEGRGVSEALFGSEFARAYAGVAGRCGAGKPHLESSAATLAACGRAPRAEAAEDEASVAAAFAVSVEAI